MMRMAGAAMLLGGGWAVSLLWGGRQRRKVEICGEFLFAAQRMEQAIRCEQRGLKTLFFELSAERGAVGRFFEDLLCLWAAEEEETLQTVWEQACVMSELSAEGKRIWQELGRRLSGDSEHVCGSITAAAERMSMLQQSLKEDLPNRLRLGSALSLSAAAFLVILLL